MKSLASFVKQTPWWWIMFLLQGVLMCVELIASRLFAPYLGVSLGAWAVCITWVLLAMALGSAFGARLTARPVPRWMMVVLGGSASIMVICMPWLTRWLGTVVMPQATGSWGWASFLALAVLVPPLFLLSSIVPILIEQEKARAAEIGRVVGSLQAAGALGSVVGVLVTGFGWLMWASLPQIFLGVGLALFLVSVGSYWLARALEASAQARVTHQVIEWKLMPKRAMLTAFVSGVSFMALQMVASRSIAPFVGMSVYTWTSVMVVMLIGAALGNLAGGKLADANKGEQGIKISLLLISGALLWAAYLAHFAVPAFAGLALPVQIRILLLVAVIFGPPTAALCLLLPQIIAFIARARDPEHVSSMAGRIYAVNTLGSLIGGMLAAYALIDLVGARGLMVGLMTLFVALAWAWGARWPSTRRAQLVAGLFVACVAMLLASPSRCLRETRYYCIRIDEQIQDGATTTKALLLDRLVHSYIRPGDPTYIGYGYERVYAHLVAYRFQPEDTFRALTIGGGGYVFPRYLDHAYAQSRQVVSEIDPAVIEVNYTELGLATSDRLRHASVDARLLLASSSTLGTFDLIFGDAVNDYSVPYHLTTVEFHRLIKAHLASSGVYALNMIDDPDDGLFLAAMVRTLQQVWGHVYVIPGAKGMASGRNTFVLLATNVDIDWNKWDAVRPKTQDRSEATDEGYQATVRPLTQQELERFLAARRVPPLTDSFAPTDRYLAPVFSKAR